MRDLDYRKYDIVVVDDEEDNLDAFRFNFRRSFSLHYALGAQAALALLGDLDAAVIVSDQRMPGMEGLALLEKAKQARPDIVAVLLTAYADLDVLVRAVNSGAVDRYVQKPWDSKELGMIMRQGVQSFATTRENRRLREQLAAYAGYLEREQRDPFDFGAIAVQGEAMKRVRAALDEVAQTTSPVLIEGEAGCEKDVIARAVHVQSARELMPFVKVTCAAFRGEALERELFGYRAGAFEGAFSDRPGRVELAHRGTLFLDEPAALAPAVQARLLHLLADGEVERVGGTESIPVDVRLVAAFTPSLAAAGSAQGGEGLLPDLASRLSVFPIHVPPLRERGVDVQALAEHFLRRYARRNPRAATSLSPEAAAKLLAYPWPGNTRELANVVERSAILARGDVIQPEHIVAGPRPPADSRVVLEDPAGPAAQARGPRDLDAQLEEIERKELTAALVAAKGNKAEMARQLGIQRTTLYYRLKKLGIET